MSNISIEDFKTNFIVQINTISIPHIDETGTIPAVVGFNIICKPNNRVQYFEYHIVDQNLVDTSTPQQLIDYTWNQLKTDINNWATNIITDTDLNNYIYVPTNNFNNNNLNLTTFNSNYNVKICRFEVYPKNDPNCWCVGFNITNNTNNVNFYIDTNVMVNTFNITQTEINIMNTAWDQVKDSVEIWALENLIYSSLINTDYTPVTF